MSILPERRLRQGSLGVSQIIAPPWLWPGAGVHDLMQRIGSYVADEES